MLTLFFFKCKRRYILLTFSGISYLMQRCRGAEEIYDRRLTQAGKNKGLSCKTILQIGQKIASLNFCTPEWGGQKTASLNFCTPEVWWGIYFLAGILFARDLPIPRKQHNKCSVRVGKSEPPCLHTCAVAAVGFERLIREEMRDADTPQPAGGFPNRLYERK